MGKEVIGIQIFSKFKFIYKDEEIEISKYMGKQLVNILMLLAYSAGNVVSSDLLIYVLWPTSKDPKNTLKFNIHRLREVLSTIDELKDLDLIKTVKNGYMLSDAYEYKCDFREFDIIYKKIENKKDIDEQDYKYALRAIELYKWKVYTTKYPPLYLDQIVTYYRDGFVKIVCKVCQYLRDRNEYDTMMNICYHAIVIEPFYEDLHYYYMQGLIDTKDYHRALKYYDDVNDAFYLESSQSLSGKFKELYESIVDENKVFNRISIDKIQKELLKNENEETGFYCTYDMFKYIYEIVLKSSNLKLRNYYLVLIDITNDYLMIESNQSFINQIKNIITIRLKVSDIYCKVNESQYLFLVNRENEADIFDDMQKIYAAFNKKYANNNYRLSYSVKKASDNFKHSNKK